MEHPKPQSSSIPSSQQVSRSDLQARLARVIGHDLNNIFTISQSYIELILRQPPEPDQLTDFLGRVLRAIRRGVHLNELLHTIGADHHLPPEECLLNEIISPLEPLIARLETPGPRWTFACAPDLPIIYSHPVELTRLIVDLCVNATGRWPTSETMHLKVTSGPLDEKEQSNILTITPAEGSPIDEDHDFTLILTDVPLEQTSQTNIFELFELIENEPVQIELGEQLIASFPAPTRH